MPVDLWSQQYPPCSASDPTSFAYSSTVTRWPTIVTSIIDHLANLNGTTNLSEEGAKDKVEQGKEIIRELAGLIYEMRHDRALTDIKGEYLTNMQDVGDVAGSISDYILYAAA